MISRNEFLYTKKKMNDTSNLIFDMEMKSDMYKKYEKFNAMSELEKDALLEKWDEFYKDCREGYYGKMYFSMREHFNNGLIDEIKRIAKEVKESKVPFRVGPTTIDPRDLLLKMEPYFALLSRLKELTATYNEYKDIFEKKEDTL